MINDFPLAGHASLSEAGRVYLENRVAIEYARGAAEQYLASLWLLAEQDLVASRSRLRFPWAVRERAWTKGNELTIAGFDWNADVPSHDWPVKGFMRHSHVCVRLNDGRASGLAGNEIRAQVGLNFTGEARKFARQYAAELRVFLEHGRKIEGVRVSVSKEEWVFLEICWRPGLTDLRADVDAVVGIVVGACDLLERFLFSELPGASLR